MAVSAVFLVPTAPSETLPSSTEKLNETPQTPKEYIG